MTPHTPRHDAARRLAQARKVCYSGDIKAGHAGTTTTHMGDTMEPNIIAKDNGLTVICGGHTIVIHDAQGESGYSVGVLLDKAVFEELQAICRMAIHTVADMGSDRAYIAAVFIARLFGGDVYTSFTETWQ